MTISGRFHFRHNQLLKSIGLAAICYLISVTGRWDFAGIASISCLVSGIALAAVLIGGNRYLWPIGLGIFAAHALHGDMILGAFTEAASATLTALVGVWLVKRRSEFDLGMGTWQQYIRLLFWGALIAPLTSFILDMLTLSLSGVPIGQTLFNAAQWWMRDALGVVLMTPLILAYWPSPSNLRPRPSLGCLKETLVILGVTGLASALIFLNWGHTFITARTGLHLDLILKAYWMFPLVVWAALRQGLRGVGQVVLIAAWAAVAGVTHNLGYFSDLYVDHTSAIDTRAVQDAQILSYWFFIICLSIIGGILASYVETEKKLITALNHRDKTASQEFRHVMDTLDQHAIITTTDVQGCITSVNDKFCEVSGYAREELLGQDHKILNSGVHPPGFFKEMYRVIARGQPWHGEICNRTKDGHLYWVQSTISALMGADDKPLMYLALRTDVTSLRKNQQELEILSACLAHTNDIVIITEAESVEPPSPKIVYVNDAFERLTGFTREEAMRGSPRLLQGPKTDRAELDRIRTALTTWSPVRAELVNYTKSGREFWVEIDITPIADKSGWFTHWISIQRDVTDRKNAEQTLRDKEFSLNEAQRIARIGSYLCDIKTGVWSASPSLNEIFGIDDSFVKDIDNWSKLIAPEFAQETIAHYQSVIRGDGIFNKDYQIIRPNDGERRWISALGEFVYDNNHSPVFLKGTVQDITERKKAEAQAHRLAFYDQLTGLPNKRLMMDRLARMEIQFRKDGQIPALLYIDLDHFKVLNDTEGHAVGDRLLCQIADYLIRIAHDSYTVARVGGDKFVVLMPALSKSLREAAVRAESYGNIILADLNQPMMLGALLHHNSVSIGVSLLNEQYKYDEVLGQAEIAMYEAKKAGRKALRFFDSTMQVAITARSNLVNAIRLAIERQEFQLYYQLQVDDSYSPIGAEALIRWENPQLGLISPDQFIPIAEETGIILQVGEWVLRKACAQLRDWSQHALMSGLILSVNISVKQIMHDDFESMVKAIIREYSIGPQRLMLELTESIFMEDTEVIVAKMNALKLFGIRFSLDDFGTGYSALQYLKWLPLDQLKIDQSFVRDIDNDLYDKSIVLAIITMAKTLNISVIAEGVENETQKQLLASNGCTEFQGYLFGMPMPIKQFEATLNRSPGKQASALSAL